MGWFSVSRIGVSDLHHRGGPVGAIPAGAVRTAKPGVAGVDVGAALLAAEDCPLGEHRKAVKCCRPAGAYCGIRQDPVIECNIDAVMLPVESHLLHLNIGIKQLCLADFCPAGSIQNFLGTSGQVDPQILDAVLIPAAVGDLSGVQ